MSSTAASRTLKAGDMNRNSQGFKYTNHSVSQIEKTDREQAAENAWPCDTKLPRGWREAQVRRTQMLPLQLPMERKK